ncbi:hypothetical protein HF086_011059 [Spodoptera exigua]|uniref:Uncharacterized protein n=1 Tax=Spodoptera exigua TaxID=7107 RepID=A0A922M831_SPOEX|nr:hypothetical protein HF086_011059 [Spodoptera exigua]
MRSLAEKANHKMVYQPDMLCVFSHSDPDSELDMVATNIVTRKSPRHKNKFYANDSKSSTLEIVAECESNISLSTAKKRSIMTMDKAVYASSSTLLNSGTATEECNLSSANRLKTVATTIEAQKKSNERQSSRRDKHPRQHRVKVRSPKRRVPIIEQQNKAVDSNKRSAGTTTIDWDIELEVCGSNNVTNIIDTYEEVERTSNHSSDDMCRICHGGESLSPELGRLISACSCRGTVVIGGQSWDYADVTSRSAGSVAVRTHPGWSDDTRRSRDALATSLDLCPSLYDPISAATRHALGWWIWYRSQYEVRLQIQENED